MGEEANSKLNVIIMYVSADTKLTPQISDKFLILITDSLASVYFGCLVTKCNPTTPGFSSYKHTENTM